MCAGHARVEFSGIEPQNVRLTRKRRFLLGLVRVCGYCGISEPISSVQQNALSDSKSLEQRQINVIVDKENTRTTLLDFT